MKLLKAGGNVNVAASSQGGEADAAALKRALTFAGFLNVADNPEDPRVLSGERAAWETGASAPVRLSFGASKNGSRNGPNGNGSAAVATAAAASKTWKLALDDDQDGAGGAEDDDLIDEDALLESSAPVKRASETVRRILIPSILAKRSAVVDRVGRLLFTSADVGRATRLVDSLVFYPLKDVAMCKGCSPVASLSHKLWYRWQVKTCVDLAKKDLLYLNERRSRGRD